MSSVKVMGHCPPDTDSTCSPIAYSWFLKNFHNLDSEAVICGKLNKEAAFVLNYFKIETPKNIDSISPEEKLVLLDTNNPEELVQGWESAEIIEIVDHHKMYGIKTPNIAKVTIRPYGCVATVIWELMSNEEVTIPKEIAGLLASCIVSDTLKLTSPTTTDIDRKALDILSKLAEINTDEYAKQMFDAKSNLDGMSANDILNSDSKDFEFNNKVYKLAVLETTNKDHALSKRQELIDEMKKVKVSEGLAGFVFFIVDILTSNAVAITSSDEDLKLVEKAFENTANSEGLIELPGIVSRKKQIVPAIEKAVLS